METRRSSHYVGVDVCGDNDQMRQCLGIHLHEEALETPTFTLTS